MKIALTHYRVGATDGVSLEMDKWTRVLRRLGHEVCYIAGSKGTSEEEVFIIDEIHISHELDREIERNISQGHTTIGSKELEEKSRQLADVVRDKLINIINENNIDILVPNNILCLGRSIPIGIGFHEAIKETNVKVINHHHDFYWERDIYQSSPHEFANIALEKSFPPLEFPTMKHCVINSAANRDLKEKKGVDSTYVPNVFDFEVESWGKDEYNSDLRANLGIKENDIFLLQATRVVKRKGIELAVDFCKELENNKDQLIGKTLYNGKEFTSESNIYLVLVGLHEDHTNYIENLLQHAKDLGINIIVCPELVDHERKIINGKKVYSLWDAYVDCDIVTYPSIYEGWGNQFLEALFAKKPQLVFEYSVFLENIKPCGFNYITLGDKYTDCGNNLVKVEDQIINDAAIEAIKYLLDNDYYTQKVDENFEIGRKNFSLEALENILKGVFND